MQKFVHVKKKEHTRICGEKKLVRKVFFALIGLQLYISTVGDMAFKVKINISLSLLLIT